MKPVCSVSQDCPPSSPNGGNYAQLQTLHRRRDGLLAAESIRTGVALTSATSDLARGCGTTLWDELRRQLGPEFLYGPGAWFCVAHEHVYRQDGRPFSERQGGSGRRVVLGTEYGPNATLFARSASVRRGFPHPKHAHSEGRGRCQIDQDGWINLRLPVSVASSALRDETYSCEEPEDSPLYAELERAVSW